LQINRELIHGALTLDESGSKVIFRDTLQLENLDLNEIKVLQEDVNLVLNSANISDEKIEVLKEDFQAIGESSNISEEDLETIGKTFQDVPLMANMVEGGKTPVLPKEQLAEMGFHLILHPLCGLFAAARAIERTYKALNENETTLGIDDQLMTFGEFNSLIGVDEKYKMAERFGVT